LKLLLVLPQQQRHDKTVFVSRRYSTIACLSFTRSHAQKSPPMGTLTQLQQDFEPSTDVSAMFFE